jgi:hypothetical protein
MYIPLNSKLALTEGADQVSMMVPMRGFNTVQIELVVFRGAIDVSLEESNDEQDWTVKDTFATTTGPAYKLLAARTVTTSMVRIRWAQSGVDPAVIGGGINLSRQ